MSMEYIDKYILQAKKTIKCRECDLPDCTEDIKEEIIFQWWDAEGIRNKIKEFEESGYTTIELFYGSLYKEDYNKFM